MNYKVSAVSDVGCVRTNNEDMILVLDQLIRDSNCEMAFTSGARNGWIAVADGMGGHNAGEVASEFVLRELAAFVDTMPANLDADEVKTVIDALVKDIHTQLNHLGASEQAAKGLGTTFCGLLFYREEIYSVNIGDSRLYRFRGNLLAQLTHDHSLRNMMNDPSIPANQIANSFGGGSARIFIDFENLTDRLFPNDILLLCTDGLNTELSDEEIDTALEQQSGCSELVNLAKAKGGRDNISCVLISLDS
jgi:serine/threonine protein phosphatase PrpC